MAFAYLTGFVTWKKTYNIFLYCIHSFFSALFHMCPSHVIPRNTLLNAHKRACICYAHTTFLYTKAFINNCSQFSIKSVWPGLVSKCYRNTPPYWLSWSPWQPLVRAFDWIWHICLPMSQIPRHQSTISL